MVLYSNDPVFHSNPTPKELAFTARVIPPPITEFLKIWLIRSIDQLAWPCLWLLHKLIIISLLAII